MNITTELAISAQIGTSSLWCTFPKAFEATRALSLAKAQVKREADCTHALSAVRAMRSSATRKTVAAA